MPLVTVIGRGHSGTRSIAHTLYSSGVFMGAIINKSGDLVPPTQLHQAARLMGQYVRMVGDTEWDFTKLHEMNIPQDFVQLIESYLVHVLHSNRVHPTKLVGWKLPETTLILPWIRRIFPDMKYIYLVRDPRDSILKSIQLMIFENLVFRVRYSKMII